jgi:DNA polymerase-3 subunit delta
VTSRPLARRSTRRAHLIVGEDSYLRQQIRDELLAVVPEEARAFAVREYSLARTGLGEIRRAATTPTLLSPQQVLILRDVASLGEEEVDELAELLDSLPPFTVLVFEETKLDGRTRVSQVLSRKCDQHLADSPPNAEAARKVEAMARELGLRLSRGRAEELVFVAGTDLGTLCTEVEKLRVYVGAEREVAPDDLAAVVVAARQFSVFDLVDLLAERRRSDALARLRSLLAQGQNPIGMVGLLAWLYRQLLIVQALPAGQPSWKIRSQVKAPAERVEQLRRQARNFTREELKEAFAALVEADSRLKASPPDPQAVVERLVLRLTQGAGVAAGRSGR